MLSRCAEAFQAQPTHFDGASLGASRLDRAYVAGSTRVQKKVVAQAQVLGVPSS